MKKYLSITATLEQPQLLVGLIEQLANRRCDIGYSNSIVPGSAKALETSSVETYVSGTVSLSNNDEDINVPFITCFIFSCVKEKNGGYELVWSSSLS